MTFETFQFYILTILTLWHQLWLFLSDVYLWIGLICFVACWTVIVQRWIKNGEFSDIFSWTITSIVAFILWPIPVGYMINAWYKRRQDELNPR